MNVPNGPTYAKQGVDEDYLIKMNAAGCYGDDIIIQAASTCYNAIIFCRLLNVPTSMNSKGYNLFYPSGTHYSNVSDKIWYIQFSKGRKEKDNHYEVLSPNKDIQLPELLQKYEKLSGIKETILFLIQIRYLY